MMFNIQHGKTATARHGGRMVKISRSTGRLLAYEGVSLDDAASIGAAIFDAMKAGRLSFKWGKS